MWTGKDWTPRKQRTSPIQTFGKYQILDLIATGGMAEIYKAKLEGIGGFQRTFAIKRILPNLSRNSENIAMLVDEAKVAGLLYTPTSCRSWTSARSNGIRGSSGP